MSDMKIGGAGDRFEQFTKGVHQAEHAAGKTAGKVGKAAHQAADAAVEQVTDLQDKSAKGWELLGDKLIHSQAFQAELKASHVVDRAVNTALGVATFPIRLGIYGIKRGAQALTEKFPALGSLARKMKQIPASLHLVKPGKHAQGQAENKGSSILLTHDDIQALMKADRGGKDKQATRVVSGTGAGKAVAEGAETLAKGLKAAPNFVYPAIVGATAGEKKMILEALDQMPLKDITTCDSITVVGAIPGASGQAIPNFTPFHKHAIELVRDQISHVDFGKGVVIHEIGHTQDFESMRGGIPFLTSDPISGSAPWGKGPYIQDPSLIDPNYAAKNHWEDFAQSHKFFYEDQASLKAATPEKFDAMAKAEKQDLWQKLFDNKPVRDVGKAVSDVYAKYPGLRTALRIGAAVTGPLTVMKGVNQYADGKAAHDQKKILDGKLEMVEGALYTLKVTSPLGLAVTGLRLGLNYLIKKGKISAKKADQAITRTLATLTAPVGLAAYALLAPPTPGHQATHHHK